MSRRFGSATALVLIALLASAAGAAEMREFADWTVGCDDDPKGICVAEAGADGAARLSVERVSAAAAGYLLAVDLPEHGLNADRPLTLKFPDGASVALSPGTALRAYRSPQRWYVTDAKVLATLLPKLVDADYATVEYFDVTGELRSTPVSLAGLKDTIAFIGERQGAAAAPVLIAPEGLPEADAPLAASVDNAGLPEAVLAQHLGSGACEDPGSSLLQEHKIVSEPLSPAALLYAVPCTATGENVSYRLYIRERGEIGGVQTLYFPTWSAGYGWSGTDLLHNVEASGVSLTTVFRGKRRDGCGWTARFTFVDYAYRLDVFRADTACKGGAPGSWPIVYEHRP